MSFNQNNIISNNTLENSIKEAINDTNYINNLAMRINNINKSNLINRNIPEDELLTPSDFKKESLNKKKDTIKIKDYQMMKKIIFFINFQINIFYIFKKIKIKTKKYIHKYIHIIKNMVLLMI